jgi:AraC-like DNA-binding protein
MNQVHAFERAHQLPRPKEMTGGRGPDACIRSLIRPAAFAEALTSDAHHVAETATRCRHLAETAAQVSSRRMEAHTATVVYIRSLASVVEAAGMARARFCDELGISEDILFNVDARVPKDVVARAWDIAAAATKNDHLGLIASLHAPPGTFPVLDHIAANMPTVGEALRAIARYCRLCDDELCMSFEPAPAAAVIGLTFPRKDLRYSRQWGEWFVGLIVSRARSLAGDVDVDPVQVTFQHPAPSPEAAARLAQMLGCKPDFGHPKTAVVFGAAALAIRIRNASAFLSRIVLRHAEADLERHGGGSETFTTFARRSLMAILTADETPRISTLARRASCSVRTVQVRLNREGTSYEKVLDLARRDLGLRYVADEDIRLMEVPLLLKYEEPSSFYRAFKRWTGATPGEYRRRLVGPATDEMIPPRRDAAPAGVTSHGARRTTCA